MKGLNHSEERIKSFREPTGSMPAVPKKSSSEDDDDDEEDEDDDDDDDDEEDENDEDVGEAAREPNPEPKSASSSTRAKRKSERGLARSGSVEVRVVQEEEEIVKKSNFPILGRCTYDVYI